MIKLAATALAALAALVTMQDTKPTAPPPKWQAFELGELVRRSKDSGRPWVGFLDRPTLSAGLYRLAQGAVDGQTPHERDEVYYVVRGRGTLEVGDERTPAGPGSVLFVAAHEPHRFVEIEEDLEVVVFFSKAPVGGEAGD